MPSLSPSRRGERGAALLLAILLVLLVAVITAGVMRLAGKDRIAAAKMATRERGLACADAGIQFGRRYFGCSYKSSSNWNAYLDGTRPGRFDVTQGDVHPEKAADIPVALTGDRDGDGALDPGTDLDGDGKPDFWVSVRDDDDERETGAADNRLRDNNLMVHLRSECINPAFAVEVGGQRASAVVEVLLAYVPGSTSAHTQATSSSNFPEAAAGGPTVVTTLSNCD